MRVIVSGWRSASNAHRGGIVHGLRTALDPSFVDKVTLVHGDGTGVDQIAADIAKQWGWVVEPHPADWDTCVEGPSEQGGCPKRKHLRPRPGGGTYCPYAGHRRNQTMIDGGGDLVVAFPAIGAAGRGGTWDLIHRAADAGLHVQVWPLAVGR